MGQKTNPTLLRLEKTNQHYKASWFSDKFYAEQLHHNYKSLTYLDKIFHKVKKTKTIAYIKAGYNFNQLFCIFPKKRHKRFKFGKKTFYMDMKRSTINKTRLNKFNFAYILGLVYGLEQRCGQHTTPWKGSGLLVNNRNVTSSSLSPRQIIPVLHSKNSTPIKLEKKLDNLVPRIVTDFSSWYKQHYRIGQASTPGISMQNKTSNTPWSSRKATESPWLSALNKPYETSSKFKKITLLSKMGLYRQLMTPSVDMTKQINLIKKNHRMRMERVLGVSSNVTFAKQSNSHLGMANLATRQGSILGMAEAGSINPYKKLSFLQRFLTFHDLTQKARTRSNLTYSSNYTTSIHFVKVSHLQQSSQFLAQKIMVGLSNRVNFPRLRRQILWDVTRSRFVKGIRVTLSGRVESRSKKAQKARDRTFQWGQTELHVLSSLVQFTQSNLITPFGNIGIKVWVCYGV